MDIKQGKDKTISVAMHTFLKDKLLNMGITGTEKYPRKASLLDKDDTTPLGEADKSKYVSSI